jgi:hypothetical protein
LIFITKKKISEAGVITNRENTNVIKTLQEGLGGIRDVLIDGRYIDDKRISSNLAGSSNQEFYFLTDKISRDKIVIDQEVEIHSLGELIQITGFPLIDKINMKLKGISFL